MHYHESSDPITIIGELRNVTILSHGKFDIKEGSALEDVTLVSLDTSKGGGDGISLNGSVRLGDTLENCDPEGGVKLYAMGSITGSAKTQFNGALLVSGGSIGFAAQADGTQGVTAYAAGNIFLTSQNTLPSCGVPVTLPDEVFEAVLGAVVGNQDASGAPFVPHEPTSAPSLGSFPSLSDAGGEVQKRRPPRGGAAPSRPGGALSEASAPGVGGDVATRHSQVVQPVLVELAQDPDGAAHLEPAGEPRAEFPDGRQHVMCGQGAEGKLGAVVDHGHCSCSGSEGFTDGQCRRLSAGK